MERGLIMANKKPNYKKEPWRVFVIARCQEERKRILYDSKEYSHEDGEKFYLDLLKIIKQSIIDDAYKNN